MCKVQDPWKASRRHVGWVFLAGGRKAHYIRDRVSLCGRWAYWGQMFIAGKVERAGKCAECLEQEKRLVREKIFDAATEAWLAEFDWKKGGERSGTK